MKSRRIELRCWYYYRVAIFAREFAAKRSLSSSVVATNRAIAQALNDRGVRTARGGIGMMVQFAICWRGRADAQHGLFLL